MKHLTLIFATLLMVACGGVTKNENNESTIDKTMPVEQIDKELADLLSVVDENSGQYGVMDHAKAFARRLEHYLRYPQTLENDMPLLKKMMHISEFPISGYKKYSFSWYEGGTMGYNYNTYIQYRDKKGKVSFIPYLNDLRYPATFWLTDFCHNDTVYYLVKERAQGMSCSWYYSVAIFSIEDGNVVYHPEFYPKELNFKSRGTEEYFIYDENGEIIDNSERPSYFVTVCGTENANSNVDVDFDPKTLTLKIKDDADTTESRTGAVVEREWRLNIAK